mmetsp:Transcript_104874/g.224120  ORF Transcript_104874/g.224120 Transcript_104874/m.224120 type:complete len:272 (+) Transcript_104874:67-882(+)
MRRLSTWAAATLVLLQWAMATDTAAPAEWAMAAPISLTMQEPVLLDRFIRAASGGPVYFQPKMSDSKHLVRNGCSSCVPRGVTLPCSKVVSLPDVYVAGLATNTDFDCEQLTSTLQRPAFTLMQPARPAKPTQPAATSVESTTAPPHGDPHSSLWPAIHGTLAATVIFLVGSGIAIWIKWEHGKRISRKTRGLGNSPSPKKKAHPQNHLPGGEDSVPLMDSSRSASIASIASSSPRPGSHLVQQPGITGTSHGSLQMAASMSPSQRGTFDC